MPMHGVAATRGTAMSNTARRPAANFEKHFILSCYFDVYHEFWRVIQITRLGALAFVLMQMIANK